MKRKAESDHGSRRARTIAILCAVFLLSVRCVCTHPFDRCPPETDPKLLFLLLLLSPPQLSFYNQSGSTESYNLYASSTCAGTPLLSYAQILHGSVTPYQTVVTSQPMYIKVNSSCLSGSIRVQSWSVVCKSLPSSISCNDPNLTEIPSGDCRLSDERGHMGSSVKKRLSIVVAGLAFSVLLLVGLSGDPVGACEACAPSPLLLLASPLPPAYCTVTSRSYCITLPAAGYTADYINYCTIIGGTYQDGRTCAPGNAVGSCRAASGQTKSYYSSGGAPWTAASAESDCRQSVGGTWSP